jgi:hypothetical protein
MIIVMKTTIDYLVSNQMAQDLDRLMGDNLPWQQAQLESGIQYFKLDEELA